MKKVEKLRRQIEDLRDLLEEEEEAHDDYGQGLEDAYLHCARELTNILEGEA